MLVFDNFNEVTAKGVEAEIEGKWKSGHQARASYTFQDARDAPSGSILEDSPRHMAKLNLIVPLYQKSLFSGVELQYLSRRKTLAGNFSGAYFLTNMNLFSQNLTPGLELSGTLYNVFNEKYGDPGSGEHKQDIIGQDGRTFRLKLSLPVLASRTVSIPPNASPDTGQAPA